MDQYDLTDSNIPTLSRILKGSIVTSFYCTHHKKWVNHDYKIAGYKDHGYQYELTLQHLDTNSKKHLYEGSKIKIRRPLVKGISDIEQPGCGGGGGGGC
tara:strand:- start:154 stop:450 length:297 start_codon:yes stop_codon:yes gene_type:complete